MQEHTITLEGKAAKTNRVPFSLLGELVPIVTSTCRRVVRFQAEGRSHLQGLPDWLNQVTSIELVTNKSTSGRSSTTRLHIHTPSLGDAAPKIFQQLSLFETTLKPNNTAFDLFEDALKDAVTGNADSLKIDTNILHSTSQFSQILDLGYERISFNGGPTPPVHITRQSLEVIERLQLEAPTSKKIIIAGKLDTLTGSRRSFSLISSGRTIRGFFPSEDNDKYKSLWDRRVVIDGEAVFKPSGDLAFIVATNILPATAQDDVWETIPRPTPRSLAEIAPRNVAFTGASSLARIVGKWPGEESDEDVAAALEILH